jgi:hypothetical protein
VDLFHSLDCLGISINLKNPTTQNISTEALCSLQPHAIAPKVANREFAVAANHRCSSMCKTSCTIAPPAQRQA